MYHIQTLAQKLIQKHSRRDLQDYACNVEARKVALIDVCLELFKEEKDFTQWLKMVRDFLMKTGEALWVMHSSELTNLGMKVGVAGVKRISGKRKAV